MKRKDDDAGHVQGIFGLHHRLVAKQKRALGFLETELGRTVPSLIAVGGHVEFKAGSRLFVRTGNSTRELDVREAMEHVARRFANRLSGVLSA